MKQSFEPVMNSTCETAQPGSTGILLSATHHAQVGAQRSGEAAKANKSVKKWAATPTV